MRLVIVLAVAAFAGQWIGLQPVFLTAVALVAWFVVAARRVGVALAAATVSIGWMCVVYAVFTLTPLIGIDPRTANGIALVGVTACLPLVARRPAAAPEGNDATKPLDPRVLLPASAGGLFWLAGLLWGLVNPSGGGLSWAMYRDSTMDLWEMRRVIDYGGIGSLGGVFNVEPLTHALSVSLVDPRVSVAASPSSASAFLQGHAYHWTVVLVLSSFLAGLLVSEFGRIGTRPSRPGVLTTALAAGTSLLLVMQPLAGVAMDLGQVNVPAIVVAVFAALLAALGARRHPPLALAIALASFGILVVIWIPFAAVPAIAAAAIALLVRRRRIPRDDALAWALPGLAVAAWSMVVYGWPLFIATLFTQPEYVTRIATETTHSHPGYWESYTNPYWMPLSATALAVAVLGAVALWRVERWKGAVVGVSVLGLGAGVVPTVIALGGLPDPLAYFPAKHLFIATMCAVPVILGGALRLWGESRALRAGAVAGVVSVAIAALLAPGSLATKASPVPVEVAAGRHFGTHDQVAGRFIEYASSDELRLPWRLDGYNDATANLMMSSVGPDVSEILLQPMRAVLRDARNDFSAEVACQLAQADLRPLVLVTADPHLAAELDAACPDAHIAIELVPTNR